MRQELEPFIRECAPVWAKAIISKTTWTALEKAFRGLMLRIVGSGSAADLAGYQAEVVVLMETRKQDWTALMSRLHELHPYQTPELIAVRIAAGAPKYMAWLEAALEPEPE